jgi:hypothetical protein
VFSHILVHASSYMPESVILKPDIIAPGLVFASDSKTFARILHGGSQTYSFTQVHAEHFLITPDTIVAVLVLAFDNKTIA